MCVNETFIAALSRSHVRQPATETLVLKDFVSSEVFQQQCLRAGL